MASIEDVTVRDFEPGDGPRILDLLNEVFAENDPGFTPRTLEQWRWVYERNPAGREIIVAEDPDGRIVGHYACIPYAVTIDGESRRCGQGVDSMVARGHRRGLQSEGLFLRTARRYFEQYGVPEHNAYGYGFPNKLAFRVGVRLLHYQPVHAPVSTLGRNLFTTADDAELSVGDSSGQIVEIERFDERVDRLFRRLQAGSFMGTIRDARFLNWRYLDCPFARHRVFGLTADDEWRGVVVCREGWSAPSIMALSELLVPADDADCALRLAHHAVSHARSVGQQRVEVWLPPTHPLFEVFTAHGFTPEDSPFNLCIKIYAPDLEVNWVRDHWYFSIGDSDVF